MRDYTKELPEHRTRYIGENDLFLEIFPGNNRLDEADRPPLLFIHGAFTGSWMWSKYIPHFMAAGWDSYCINLRGHYKSRSVDFTKVEFEHYLDDIREAISAIAEQRAAAPVVIGFSMGGLLSQKLAESVGIAGLVLIDSSISREVHDEVPYQDLAPEIPGVVIPAPVRDEQSSPDETPDDIAFQRKYLSMESARAFRAFSFHFGAEGISIDGGKITCPSLVISAVNDAAADQRGQAMARHIGGEYLCLWGTTHTGLLVGQRYHEAVSRIMIWLARFDEEGGQPSKPRLASRRPT
ncbi:MULTISPECIES: alpha/beta hydrolase [Rhizobium]|uniref:alpha/beta hydrolase n=1 Tax=Rhizobium TaxID=379 RepID=UPI0007E98110|nr:MULTISPECIES: alpha/beta fold hydrolase [Rhizobium]ANK95431.1 alpha/beta hydrolase family protein [Rhizobium sp. N6212]ANL01484.1 alpha/beta hydrolase family protein [Rhizobium sp. N621]ANL07607.1 alpha/beta hydrolase family protein [Rhizobium esperanzae]ANL13777.1 alpha/beta hydrolase family protein [Rhizobium sp. N1341]ANL25761.1 alpha/beta hydrolase family protein [Rhizobium sp. N113]